MGHVLAKCRIIGAIAVLALAALALVVVAGIPAMNHAPVAQAQTMVDQHEHHDHDLTGVPGHGGLHQPAIHSDLAHCCHDEDGEPDCASICAAMAGCPMQIMPGEGMIDIVTSDTGPISGKAAFHAAISVIPSTPPPKARI